MQKLYRVFVFIILVFGILFLSYGIYGAVEGKGSYITNILNGITQILCSITLMRTKKSEGKW